ncbi:alternate-type signal peptide domain-containing protein [Gordonia sp. PDNC005]|uniref:alternate-type signal peptide domain-containing protein n=1 Tax=unclassified Gordonia (in: high G+C Gram-positive bacteria) TaxID=2657482 RepID=UPI001963C76D|nr:alternate-type signal peptide domain-containing protein [Gordonia sp. PDNC005]QRY62020.1 alternate-type signal peptide domain-containing protein [Gordonia sp. PDNC005]
MNKVTKGALAAAAGAAILAGGAGTMAAWNSNVGTNGGTVTAGQLNLTSVDAGSWKWVGGAKDGQAFVPATDRLVPGDTVRYTATYKITAVGTNLTATLTPSLGGVTGDLSSYLTATPTGGAGATVTAADNNTNKTVSTDITFKTATTGTDGQNKTADLSGATVTLQQN